MLGANLVGHFLELLAMSGRSALRDLPDVKNYDTIARRLNLVTRYSELRADTKRCNLAFNQALGTLRQRLLHFANTNHQHAALAQTVFDGQLGKKMRLARAPSTIGTLIAGRLQQWLEDTWRLKLKSSGRQ